MTFLLFCKLIFITLKGSEVWKINIVWKY